MYKKQERSDRGFGLNIGSASIIMLFAVLSLTVLAALSLLSSNAQLRLTERSAATLKNYYTADAIAAQTLNAIRRDDAEALRTLYDTGGIDTAVESDTLYYDTGFVVTYACSVRVSARLSLDFVIEDRRGNGGYVERATKHLSDIGDWTPDEGIDIWEDWQYITNIG